MAPTVSFIIPFYGTSHSQRLELAIESIFAQKGVNIDLIVAGLSHATKIDNNEGLENYPKKEMPDIAKMGKVLNRGLSLAGGNFTYISDADVLLYNRNYLSNLVQELLSQRKSL